MKPSFGNPKLEKFLFCDLRDKKNKFNGEIQKIRHYRYNTFFKEFFFLGGGGAAKFGFGPGPEKVSSRP